MVKQSRAGEMLIFIWLLAAVGLSACREATTGVLPTSAPTAAQMPIASPTAAATQPPRSTSTAFPPTLLPTATPCQYAVQPALAAAWEPAELGCPITSGATAVATAYAPFEGGQMIWRGDTDAIYVLFSNGRWASYPNEWREGDPEYSCGEASSPPTPLRGFGRVWCDDPVVREALSAVTAAEIGDSASTVQDFANGSIVIAPFGDPFVFVGEAGVWRRVEE